MNMNPAKKAKTTRVGMTGGKAVSSGGSQGKRGRKAGSKNKTADEKEKERRDAEKKREKSKLEKFISVEMHAAFQIPERKEEFVQAIIARPAIWSMRLNRNENGTERHLDLCAIVEQFGFRDDKKGDCANVKREWDNIVRLYKKKAKLHKRKLTGTGKAYEDKEWQPDKWHLWSLMHKWATKNKAIHWSCTTNADFPDADDLNFRASESSDDDDDDDDDTQGGGEETEDDDGSMATVTVQDMVDPGDGVLLQVPSHSFILQSVEKACPTDYQIQSQDLGQDPLRMDVDSLQDGGLHEHFQANVNITPQAPIVTLPAVRVQTSSTAYDAGSASTAYDAGSASTAYDAGASTATAYDAGASTATAYDAGASTATAYASSSSAYETPTRPVTRVQTSSTASDAGASTTSETPTRPPQRVQSKSKSKSSKKTGANNSPMADDMAVTLSNAIVRASTVLKNETKISKFMQSAIGGLVAIAEDNTEDDQKWLAMKLMNLTVHWTQQKMAGVSAKEYTYPQ